MKKKKNKKKQETKGIEKNINWFKKFSLEKRLRIAEIDQRVTKVLRGLTIKSHVKPGRAD